MRRDPTKRTPAPQRPARPSSTHPRARPIQSLASDPELSPQVEPIPVRSGVVSLSGYGVSVAVERGQLVLSDGTGNSRRAGRLSRATSGLKRLVVRGQGGYITFDALHWLFDVGAAFVQIGYDGQVVVATGPQGLNEPQLRRAQALAPWNDTGLAIMRDILRAKLQGQASVLDRIPDSTDAATAVRVVAEQLDQTDTLDRMRSLEAKAASVYWGSWEKVTFMFVRKDEQRVPEHWRSFGARMSRLSTRLRYAVNPPNAILNYLYAVLEAEATIAVRAVGLDPGMGILHVDVKSRDSLALDLMEAVRPQVDAFVLDLLAGQLLAAAWFFETNKGVCRILPPLTHTLAETAPIWRSAVAPIVEQVAQVLQNSGRSLSYPAGRSVVTKVGTGELAAPWRKAPTRPLQAKHVSTLAAQRKSVNRRPSPPAALLNACRSCGVVLERRKRR